MNCIIDNQLISFEVFDNFEDGEFCDLEFFFLHGWRSQKEVWHSLIQNLFLDSQNEKSKTETDNLKNRTWNTNLQTENCELKTPKTVESEINIFKRVPESDFKKDQTDNSKLPKNSQDLEVQENNSNKSLKLSQNLEKKTKIRIWTLDLPGFGRSSLPKTTWKVDDYAELVQKFIVFKSQKNTKKIIIGHSFGGRIGIKLAYKLKLENQKIQSKNLSGERQKSALEDGKSEDFNSPKLPGNSPNPLFEKEIPNSNILEAGKLQIDRLILIGSHGFVDNSVLIKVKKLIAKILKPIFQLKFLQNVRKKILQKVGSEDYLERPELLETFKLIIGEDLTDNMRQIDLLTLLIFGENDAMTPPKFGEKMQKLIKNSKLQILKNTGHFAFLDEPKIVSQLIWKFLKK